MSWGDENQSGGAYQQAATSIDDRADVFGTGEHPTKPSHRLRLVALSSLGISYPVHGVTLVKQVHHSHPQLYFRGTLGDEAVIDPIDF